MQHHYVLDILLGSAYALAGYAALRLVSARLERAPTAVVVGTTQT